MAMHQGNGDNANKFKNIGKNLNFAASESYKRLRTNILFSLPGKEENEGYAIGITSSIRGEGKSTTSINIAYEFAESGRHVVLLECDMRLPVMAKNLDIPSEPGLSECIVGLSKIEDAIITAPVHPNLDIIPSGSIPPNPSELLGTRKFKNILKTLLKTYDFVVIDLPPVSSVSDALVVANDIDGMVVVVRQDLCNKRTLGDTMRQLNMVKEKILGFVYNGATPEGQRYKKRYYKYEYGYDGKGRRTSSKRQN